MQNTIIAIMYSLYNTFVDFSGATFDYTSASSLFDAIAGTGEAADNSTVDDIRDKFATIRMDAARESIILSSFINRYESGTIPESDMPKILSVLQEALKIASDVYTQLEYAANKKMHDRYKRHLRISKAVNNITMIRQALDAYNSKLIDYSEIDQILENFPFGILIFDSSVDNTSLQNDAEIVLAKLIALLIKLKDGGVKWADNVLHKVTMTPQDFGNVPTKEDENIAVNELDQK